MDYVVDIIRNDHDHEVIMKACLYLMLKKIRTVCIAGTLPQNLYYILYPNIA